LPNAVEIKGQFSREAATVLSKEEISYVRPLAKEYIMDMLARSLYGETKKAVIEAREKILSCGGMSADAYRVIHDEFEAILKTLKHDAS
jgi:hypothetical protein